MDGPGAQQFYKQFTMGGTPGIMEAFSNAYFSFNPIFRGALACFGVWLGVELLKPGFAFAEMGDGMFYARPWGKDSVLEVENEEIAGTRVPWFLLPVGAFILFGLFI